MLLWEALANLNKPSGTDQVDDPSTPVHVQRLPFDKRCSAITKSGTRCRGRIRPTVILRKNSQSNRSDRGAASQAVQMSVYRTLRLRGLNPTQTITDALKTYLITAQLPPLPA